MPQSFDLSVRVNKQEAEKLHVEIEDQDWHTLVGYLEDFDQLAATRMGNCQIKIKFTFDARTGFSWSGEIPPEDDVAAFLHRLRPFVLNDERSNFNRVCNILGRAIAHPGMTGVLRQQRDEFTGRAFRSQVQLFSNNTVVNTEEALQDWLNAYEYHRDSERRERLAKIHHELLPLEALRPVFVSMLIDKARAVATVAEIVRMIVNRQKGRELRFGKLSIPPAKSQPASSSEKS